MLWKTRHHNNSRKGGVLHVGMESVSNTVFVHVYTVYGKIMGGGGGGGGGSLYVHV